MIYAHDGILEYSILYFAPLVNRIIFVHIIATIIAFITSVPSQRFIVSLRRCIPVVPIPKLAR